MLTFRDYTSKDRLWVYEAHVRHYRDVERFDATFDDAVRSALDHLEQNRDVLRCKYIIVEDGPRPVGCVFLGFEAPRRGRVRLFYLDDAYRGQGVGRRMIEMLKDHALKYGLDTLLVSTFDRHVAACILYAGAGFAAHTHQTRAHFGQNMAQIDFAFDLRPSE